MDAEKDLSWMFAALSATNEAILRAQSESDLYQRVCEAAVLGGRFLGAAVLLATPQGLLKCVAGAGSGVDVLRGTLSSTDAQSEDGQGLTALAYRAGRSFVTNDYINDPKLSRWHAHARQIGTRSAAAIPIKRGGITIGALLFYLEEPNALSATIIALLERMAENVVFSLQNFDREQLRTRAEQASTQINRFYAALTATNDAILRAPTEGDMFRLVCDSAVEHGELLGAAIFLHDDDSSWFSLAAGTGKYPDIIAKLRFSSDPTVPEGQGMGGTAFRNRTPYISNDVAGDPRSQPWMTLVKGAGLTACAVFPLFSEKIPVGVMYIFLGGEVGQLDDAVVKLMTRIAENVSFGIERFRQSEQKNRFQQQNERLFSAINNMSKGLILFDDQRNIIICNKRYAQMYKLPADLVQPGCLLTKVLGYRRLSGTFFEDPEFYMKRERSKIDRQGRHEYTLKTVDGRSIRVLNEALATGGFISLHEDITDDVLREASFKLLFDNNPVPMWVFDQDTLQILAVNGSAIIQYGYDRQQFLGLKLTDLRPVEDRAALVEHLKTVPTTERRKLDVRHKKSDGSLIDICIYSHALSYEGRRARLVAALDMTEQNKAENNLRETQKFLDAIIENVPIPIVVKTPPPDASAAEDWTYALLNRAAETFFGVNRDAWIGKTVRQNQEPSAATIVCQLDQQALSTDGPLLSRDLAIVTKGVQRAVNSRRVAIRNDFGVPQYLVALLEDVTEQRQAADRIAYIAHHDSLTDLPNRAAFEGFFADALSRAQDQHERLTIMCMDLDGFKDINDRHGHSTGDTILQAVADRLKTAAEGAFLARCGGDEFALVLQGNKNPDYAEALAERLIAAANAAFDVEGNKLRVGLSVGISSYPTHGNDCKTLLANADLALYRAKSLGRGTACYFSLTMDNQVRERRALKEDLQRALERGEFHLHYQPQVAMDRTVIGHEALLRWRSKTHGDVPPDTFIPLAEESGLIVPLGEWVLREVCREVRSWPGQTKVAVNISPQQFRNGDLPNLVHAILLETGLPASRLELEITEGVFINDFSQALSILARLKALGVDIALDDFGTGYSSLSYLHAFSFDRLKIDRAFIMDLENNRRAKAIVRAIIGLARSLELPVLAEGVETEQQLSLLREMGCDAAQGYLIGRPQPAAVLKADSVQALPALAIPR